MEEKSPETEDRKGIDIFGSTREQRQTVIGIVLVGFAIIGVMQCRERVKTRQMERKLVAKEQERTAAIEAFKDTFNKRLEYVEDTLKRKLNETWQPKEAEPPRKSSISRFQDVASTSLETYLAGKIFTSADGSISISISDVITINGKDLYGDLYFKSISETEGVVTGHMFNHPTRSMTFTIYPRRNCLYSSGDKFCLN